MPDRTAADVTADATDALEVLTADAGDLDVSLLGLDAVPVDVALRLLKDLRAVTARLATVDAALTRHAYLNGEHGLQDYGDGLGRVRITRTRDGEKWDERGAIQAVLDAHLSATGEQPEPWTVVEWLLAAGSFGYFRKTYLRGLHIDPADVYESRPGKPQVSFT